jgi:hypothetical protein
LGDIGDSTGVLGAVRYFESDFWLDLLLNLAAVDILLLDLPDSLSSDMSFRLGTDGERRAKNDMDRLIVPEPPPRGGDPLDGETMVVRGMGTASGT